MAENKDRYMGLVLDGQSPFNGRPSTHFRQAVLGVMKEPFCAEIGEIESPEDVEMLSSLPIQPRIPFECPEKTEHTIRVRATLPFKMEHDKVKGYRLTSITYSSESADLLVREGDNFAVLAEGEYTIYVEENYEDEFTCNHTYTIKASAPPKTNNEGDEEDEEGDNEYVPGLDA